jgi:hypothetical protein
MTGLNPEQRFINHKNKHKYNYFVYRYGDWLLEELLAQINPMRYADAATNEKRLARSLRLKGYAVWQK